MIGRVIIPLGATLLYLSAATAEPAPTVNDKSGLRGIFWTGVNSLHTMFQAIGTLSNGPNRGALWQFDLQTHVRSNVGSGDSFAWPVQGPNGQAILALHGNQVVKVGLADGRETPLGPKAAWLKLIGVASNETVLGFVEQAGISKPALLTLVGKLSVLPSARTTMENKQTSLLLQEDRAYDGNRRLVVARSERGGRGFDVYYITDQGRLDVSDCGDDVCGQPSLSFDERHVLYVRSAH